MSDGIWGLCRQAVGAGDRIVAAVSGGADSICLAHALKQACSEVNAQLFIAHINHQLRGEAADADARFVCSWAAQLNLPRAIVRIDVPATGGESVQTCARQKRYTALAGLCRRFVANKLVTAHHADDQVETFLLNLLRGSGSKGLQGIPRERPFIEGVRLLRPLLDVSRADIEDYCRIHNLTWRTDASNDSLYYQRNRVRHQLLPVLREYNPGIDKVILNTVNNLRMDQEVLSALARRALIRVSVPSPLAFAPQALSVHGLQQLKAALRNRIILGLLPQGTQSKHVEAVLSLLEASTGASVDLPGGFKVYRLHDRIAFGTEAKDYTIHEIQVPIPGHGVLGETLVQTDIKYFPGSRHFWLPEHIKEIIVGPRRPGDYFYPPGGGKKLKDYMIDKKVPRWLRNSYPVFRAGGEIFWIAGLARDTRFVEDGNNKKSVYIKIVSNGGDNNGK